MNLVPLVCLLTGLPMQVGAVPAASAAAAAPATSKAPPRIAKFLELCETTRRGAIMQLEHELRKQQSAPSAQRSPVKISQLEGRLKELHSGELVVPTISFPPQPGAIGRLPDDACYVEQIISPEEVLIRCHFRVPVTTVRDFRAYRDAVVQPVTAVIRGWKQPVSEGQDTTTNETFEVVGRERYTTERGAHRTVLILKPFDKAELAPYLRKAVATKPAGRVATGAPGG